MKRPRTNDHDDHQPDRSRLDPDRLRAADGRDRRRRRRGALRRRGRPGRARRAGRAPRGDRLGRPRRAPAGAPLDDVFSVFSVTKTLTTAARADAGRARRARAHHTGCRGAPEFGNRGKQRVTVAQLLTHMAGLPAGLPPRADGAARRPRRPSSPPHAGSRSRQRPGRRCTTAPSPPTRSSPRSCAASTADGGVSATSWPRTCWPRSACATRRSASAPTSPSGRCRSSSATAVPGIFEPELLEAFNVLVTPETEIPAASAVSTRRRPLPLRRDAPSRGRARRPSPPASVDGPARHDQPDRRPAERLLRLRLRAARLGSLPRQHRLDLLPARPRRLPDLLRRRRRRLAPSRASARDRRCTGSTPSAT